MRKIIFISIHPYSLRDYYRFGAYYLEKEGYDIELWEVRLKDSYVVQYSAGMYDGSLVLTEYELRKAVLKNRDAVYLVHNGMRTKVIKVLCRYRCKYIVFWGQTLQPINQLVKNDTVANRLKAKYNFFIKSIKQDGLVRYGVNGIRKVLRGKVVGWGEKKISDAICKHPPISTILSTSEALKTIPGFLYKGLCKSDLIYVHAYDYDRYLEILEEREQSTEYIVYIDVGLGNVHIDTKLQGIYNPFDGREEEFWMQLERTFKLLEEHYNVPVIIAGHPHVQYNEKILQGRKIIFNQTHRLVSASKFVIMQMSAAINFALLFHKDILVLYNGIVMQLTDWEVGYKQNMKLLGLTPCNMDNPDMQSEPWKYISTVDERIRKDYIRKYIKEPGTPEKLTIEVVEDIIKKLD